MTRVAKQAADVSADLPLEGKDKAFTTAEVNQMLWNKYTEKGEHVFLFDVPDVVGLHQSRRCDGIAIGMWGSSGRLIEGFEVKVSRSDWLRELKHVNKADPFIERCDRWWLVTGSASIAKFDEIPAVWGWMTATKSGLRIQKPAHKLPQDRDNMARLWAFALIRRAAENKATDSPENLAKIENARAGYERAADERVQRELARVSPAYEKLRAEVDKFEQTSGMKLGDWRLGNVGALARKLHEISDDSYSGYKHSLSGQVGMLRRLADATQEVIDACNAPALAEDAGQ